MKRSFHAGGVVAHRLYRTGQYPKVSAGWQTWRRATPSYVVRSISPPFVGLKPHAPK
jgi:hypothetical protein